MNLSAWNRQGKYACFYVTLGYIPYIHASCYTWDCYQPRTGRTSGCSAGSTEGDLAIPKTHTDTQFVPPCGINSELTGQLGTVPQPPDVY